MKQKLDFFGNEINLGDKIAVVVPGYRCLVEAEVIKICDLKIKVKYKREFHSEQTTHVYPQDCVKKLNL